MRSKSPQTRETPDASPQTRESPDAREERLISATLPAFAEKLRQLLANMRAEGFDPMIGNTGRTVEQARANEVSGKGIADSMHLYGAAADIPSKSKGWSSPEYFVALNRHATAIGLTTGFYWRSAKLPEGDPAHVQALPVAKQNAFRALPNDSARNTFLRNLYGVA